ncbi:MAG: UDP-N-acetylmuramoyl-tripeptide--D-alanyl-D-alanine ligase [Actinomycetota bacterium]
MRARKLSEIAEVTGGRLAGDDAVVSSVVADSRLAVEGSLFFALKGKRTDGHDHVADAASRGAVSVVQSTGGSSVPAIHVADTEAALGDLAGAERLASRATVVGITGSSGKTSTKDLLAAVLASRFSVTASPASYNTEIGVPLTILAANEETDVIVCEMGSRGIGHIAQLCDVAEPDVGIVTNVGTAHMELFGSQENLVQAKRELVEALKPQGTAVLSADDPAVRGFGSATSARVITFGSSDDAQVRAEDFSLGDDGAGRFRLRHEDEIEDVQLGVPGEHMIQNALAAAAAGIALGVSVAEAGAALKDARVSAWRMEVFTNDEGVVVVNDAYNANPQSMAAALKTARWMARNARMAAVLGQMAELGPISLEEHERVGRLVARLGVERLITVGDDASPIANGAAGEGMEPENIARYENAEEAVEDARSWGHPGDVVLFKASRVAALERGAEAMR